MINILNFEASNLKLYQKASLGLDIYYTGYVDKKPDWNVNSVNPLYLIINRFYGTISEKNGIKYLNIDKNDDVLKKYDQVFSGIKHHIKRIDNNSEYEKDHKKIKFLTDDDIPLNKMIYFPTATAISDVFLKKILNITQRFT